MAQIYTNSLLGQEMMNASHDDDTMFVLEGTVSTLYITDGTVNLLKGMQSKMAGTGLAAAIEGMAGTVAGAAMVSMYEGEDVQHFGCYVGDQLVIGTFESVGFAEGDEVKIIATKVDERAVFAHAVVRQKDQLLWMPYAISKGRMKVAQWIATAFLYAGLFLLGLLIVANIFFPIHGGFFNFFIFWLLPALLGTGAFIGGGAFWSSLDDARYAERIITTLGFRRPWFVNLSPYSQARLRFGPSYHVYDLRKALAAHGST